MIQTIKQSMLQLKLQELSKKKHPWNLSKRVQSIRGSLDCWYLWCIVVPTCRSTPRLGHIILIPNRSDFALTT